ncbi:MAG: CHAT domain-containing protein [Acidobacteriota bacterium]
MDFGRVIEGALWRKCDQGVAEAIRQLESNLARPSSGVARQSQYEDFLVEAYSTACAQSLSAAKGSWLMSGRTQPRKGEQLALLQRRLEKIEGQVLALALEVLSEKDFKRLKAAVGEKIYGIRISTLAEFKSLEDPLKRKAARPMGDTGKGYNPRAKIVFLAADPSRTRHGEGLGTPLNLDVEIRDIDRAIQASRFRDQLELVPILATTRQDLLNALNSHRPTVVHFSGHGLQAHGIVLLDSEGKAAPVGSDFLASVLTSLSGDIRLVVLNACHSENQARAIASSVPVTIGTEKGIGDESAVAFSTAFYSALANGLSMKQAFDQGQAILGDMDSLDAPKMMSRADIDPSKQRLVRDPRRDDFEPLATALSSSMRIFLNRPAQLKDLLEKSRSRRFRSGLRVGMPVISEHRSSLQKLGILVEQDRGRAKDLGETLDGIGRRWSRHLSDVAVGKLTRLEQAVGSYVSDVRAYSSPVVDAMNSLSEMLAGAGEWTEPHAECMDSLIQTLDSLSRFIDTSEAGIRLAYNLLIEVLPGDLVARGLLKAV